VLVVEHDASVHGRLGDEDGPVLASQVARLEDQFEADLFQQLPAGRIVQRLSGEPGARRRRPRPVAVEVGPAGMSPVQDEELPP
jgi:hypothetical protein